MSTLTELITKFSFQGNSKPLNDYADSLGKSLKGITAFTAATYAAGIAAVAWISPTLEQVDVLGNLSQELNVSVAQIQEWGFAAQMSNSSAEELNYSLQGLAQRAAMVKNGIGGSDEAFSKLGVTVTDSNGRMKNSAALLDEVRQNMNRLNLSTGERSAFAKKLGISPGLVQLLSRTDSEMQDLILSAREMGTLNAEQAEAAAEYNDALDALRYTMMSIRQFTATALAPTFTDLIKQFSKLLVENRGWIVDGLKFTITLITDVIAMVGRLTPALIGLGVVFVALKIYTLGLSGALALLFSPAILIAAGIAAIAVAVDDLIVGFQGGDSVIGDFFKNFLNLDLTDVVAEVKVLWGWIMEVVAMFKTAYSFGKMIFGTITGPDPGMLVSSGRGGGGNSSTTDNRKVEQKVEIKINTDDPVRAGNIAADSIRQQVRDGNAQLGVGGF